MSASVKGRKPANSQRRMACRKHGPNRTIEILVRGVCVRRGYVLLCRNRENGNVYLPGGHVEWGESVVGALRREIQEELGFVPRVGRFLGVCEQEFIQEGRRVCELSLCFDMSGVNARPPNPPASAEAKLEFFWVPLQHLKQSEMKPAVLRNSLAQWWRKTSPSGCHWASDMPR